MSNSCTEKQVIDYLDKPPQRYAHEFQRNSGSREMVECDDGAWVKFEDMDLYMFEGAQMMKRLATENDHMRAEVARINSLAVHLNSGGRDPDEKCYSKRDVEALIAITRAVEKKHG